MLPLITLEEHFISTKVRSGKDDHYNDFPPSFTLKFESLGDERIQDMNNGSVSLQVLSHAPLDASPSACSDINNELALAISKNPDRFAGFATLPMEDSKAAAEELSRCVTKLGFLGALINNHLNGQFYDDGRFWPVFEKAQELDVPIYIHPTYPSESMLEPYKGNYDDRIASQLSAYGWGWHSDTGLHILRLFASGFFDRFPEIKIIIGHMGELLPFQLDRIAGISQVWGEKKRDLMEVWKCNIWITTSGMFSLAPLACLLQTTTIDHVMYSVDYPFSSNEKGKSFIEEIQKSGIMSAEDLEKFAYRNAEILLRVKAKTSK
ncbi:Decarboxylase [Lachnellula hyalina]|uniref:Decarboxylase n=1 Tax=Lachnellula hyalina TaxID=1316788 RepID=A0A8H8U2T3_9HELO|nr:Decarboxylase [Lachnellula hyalina]TVY29318.1 Decarboxylase [Lachnellula hyalina]